MLKGMYKKLWKYLWSFESRLGSLASINFMKSFILIVFILSCCIALDTLEKSSEPFVVEKDELILDKMGSAAQMKARLEYLVGKYKTIEEIDRVIFRDNPTVVKSVYNGVGLPTTDHYRYSVTINHSIFNFRSFIGALISLRSKEIYIIGIITNKGKITEVLTNIGDI